MGRIWAQVQSVRVGQPAELSRRAAGAGESVHPLELAVVHYRILDAARFGYRTEVSPISTSTATLPFKALIEHTTPET